MTARPKADVYLYNISRLRKYILLNKYTVQFIDDLEGSETYGEVVAEYLEQAEKDVEAIESATKKFHVNNLELSILNVHAECHPYSETG